MKFQYIHIYYVHGLFLCKGTRQFQGLKISKADNLLHFSQSFQVTEIVI